MRWRIPEITTFGIQILFPLNRRSLKDDSFLIAFTVCKKLGRQIVGFC
jgi:hypothetical protein